MKVLVDTHTHTNCSNHAFWNYMGKYEVRKGKGGLEMVCMTNHAPAIPDSPHIWHFNTMKELPEYIEGVRLLCGCEENIPNSDGEIDMPVQYLKSMDVVVASIHPPCYESKDLPDHTETWLNVVKNPYVNIMGTQRRPAFSV